MSDAGKKDCCHIDITINSKGDVNIYNCPPASAQPQTPETPAACGPAPVCPGACLPLGLGTKPKQSQRQKLDKLLGGNQVPSVFAGAFVHLTRRFLGNLQPANALEQSVFDRLQAFPPDIRAILRCALDQFDALDPAERSQLFDTEAFGDVTTPIDVTTFASALSVEVGKRASLLTFGDPDCVTEEPGRIRVFDPGPGEFFESQVRICRVNSLRTLQYTPVLSLSDYLPEELQRQCAPAVVNGELQVTCSVQKHNCPGHESQVDGTCFRVQEVEAGQSVLLEGVNFFSTDTTVRLVAKGSGEAGRVVDTHVCGDLETPVNETINGETVLIADCRVHDRLTFTVPNDLLPGIYELYVQVPNITGIATLGTLLTSSAEYLAVTPPSTARFAIVSERLIAHKETSPAFFGSDEIAFRFLTAGLKGDGTWCQLQHVDSLHGDVDSGDERPMVCELLPAQDQPFSAISILVLGHEVDNYPTYLAQAEGFTEGYLDILDRLWKIEVGGIAAMAALAIPGGPLAVLVAAAIMTALFAAVNFFLALWAPADLIAHDVIFLTAADLVALTSDNYAAPNSAEYDTVSDIRAKIRPVSKGGNEYVESRDYTCDDEDSRYEIILRYRRTA